jgi:hypothetical protein
LLSSIARLRFTGWFPCCAYQAKQSSTIEKACGIFGRLNKFSTLDSKKVLAETPVGAVQQFMSWVSGPLAGFEVIMSGRF